MSIKRVLVPSNEDTFFLWGPRLTGKTTLLKEQFPEALYIDLLKRENFIRFTTDEPLFAREIEFYQKSTGKNVVIVDEIQKVPNLLDEVHRLIENNKIVFGLSGSSTRKLRRGNSNLLGGRALRYEMRGLVYPEITNNYDLINILNRGTLPKIYLSNNYQKYLRAYVEDYLKEEILSEGIVRSLPPFADFLRIIGITDTEIIEITKVASECGVSRSTVENYYQILQDTLIGSFLKSFTLREKRRVKKAPKFYFFDVGLVNQLSRRGQIKAGSPLFGKAFENYLVNEIKNYNVYSEKFAELSYWRLDNDVEVDLLVNDNIALEIKGKERITDRDLRGLRELAKEHNTFEKRYLVALVPESYITQDKIIVLPILNFLQQLWNGDIF